MRENSVETSGKKKRVVNIVLILLVIVCFAVWAIDYFKTPGEEPTLEQRVIGATAYSLNFWFVISEKTPLPSDN